MNDLRKKSINKKIQERHCSRTVPISICQTSKLRADYWKKKLDEIDSEVATPHALRKEYIQKLLPPDVFNAVSNVLHFESNSITPVKLLRSNSIISVFTKTSRVYESSDESSSEGESHELSEFESIKQLQLEELTTTKQDLKKLKSELIDETVTKKNPYIKFLRKSPEDANIWLPKKPPDYRAKPLLEKSAIITHNILSDFVRWLDTLGPINSDIQLNEETLNQKFRIGTNEFAQRAMCVQVKEVASVPENIAKTYKNSQKSTRNVLQHHLEMDMKAEKKKMKYSAFSTSLPIETLSYPPDNNTYNQWIKCAHAPEDLKTMEHVFKGITHIFAVKAYCHWLVSNPTFHRPQYLIDLGMIDESFWKHSESIDTQYMDAFVEATIHKEFDNNDNEIRSINEHLQTWTNKFQ